MPTPNPPIAWKHLRNTLCLFSPLWLGASLLFGLGGLAFAKLSTDYWTANQPMVLRDETGGATERLGRFGSQTELKAAQETTLEMARNPEVVAAALRKIGPPARTTDPAWPTAEVIEQVASKRVNVRAPQGGEFGVSDMFYLQVEQDSPQRARAFCEALFESLAIQMREVRRVRADSMIAELTQARELAQENLAAAGAELREIEIAFGSDLGELRNMTETVSGEGVNRRALEETSRELQVAELELEKLEALNAFLARGLIDPTHLLISGAELLSRQPSLQRLKDGFIDAQLARSRLSGNLRKDHPRMKAAETAEASIHQAMKDEIESVIESMEPMLKVERDRVRRLSEKKANLESRLDRLAEGRTRYGKLVSEVRHRTTLLEHAQRALADAEASRTAAISTNLIVKLGPVSVGDRPNGPSTKMLTLGGTAAGLIFGLGTVFLVAPGPYQPRFGRRWSDRLGGRRASDVNLLAASLDAVTPEALPSAAAASAAPPAARRPEPGPSAAPAAAVQAVPLRRGSDSVSGGVDHGVTQVIA